MNLGVTPQPVTLKTRFWISCTLLALWVIAANGSLASPSIPEVSQFTAVYPALDSDTIIKKAVRGDVLAQHELANRLAGGINGLPLNTSMAARWYSLAAQRGFPGSPSIDVLPNIPIRIDRTKFASRFDAPVARLAAMDESSLNSLNQLLDGSQSMGDRPITRVVWDIVSTDNDSASVLVTPSGPKQAQVQFPHFGSWYVTLIVMDSHGQLDHVTRRVDLQQPVLQAPNAPVAIGPADQLIAFNDTANFQWITSNGAASYEFELHDPDVGSSDPLLAMQLTAADCQESSCAIPVKIEFPSYGSYSWRVRALNAAGASDWTTTEFIVSPPVPGTPANVAPLVSADVNEGATINFIWQADPLAVTYEFHFFERISGTEVEFEYDLLPSALCSEGECSLTRLVNLPVSDNHAWRVRARNAGGVSDWSRSVFNVIEPVTDPPAQPVLIAPAAEAIVEADLLHSFSWTAAELASAYEFQLINGNPDDVPLPEGTVTAFVPSSNCTVSTCSISVAVEFPAGTGPLWRVRSINPAGESAWVSSTFTIIAMAIATPELPVVVSPLANTDLIANQTAEFMWQYDSQAATYEFHFFNNAPPNRGAREPFITGLRPQDLCIDSLCTYHQLVDLPEYTAHAWRVRARNSLGVSDWTRTTFNAVELVTNPPPTPLPIAPVASALLELDTTVNFSWAAQELASQYEFKIVDTIDDSFNAIAAFVPAQSCSIDTCAVSIELAVPLSENYRWQVRAANAAGASEFTVSPFSVIPAATMIPQMPEIVAPVAGLQLAINDTVEFSWVKEPNVINYEFHFFDNSSQTTTPFITGLRARDICTDMQCVLSLPIELPIASDHAWRVRGQNSLGYSEWSRTVFDAIEPITEPPRSFVLLEPATGETVIKDSEVDFSWQPALRAIQYEVAISDSTDVEASPLLATVLAGSCSDDQCTYTTPMTLPVADSHSWQVRAINSLGESESALSSFRVGLEVIEPPQMPVVIAPDAGAVVLTGSTVEFQWQADSDATAYEFYITDALNGALPITTDLLPSELCDALLCTHTLELDLPVSELHTWHARIFHDDLASSWSQRAISVVDSLGNESPIAHFVISGFAGDASGVAPLPINVNPANSTDDVGIELYTWDFGDSSGVLNRTTADVVSHEYAEPGSYTVTLTVTDGVELSAESTALVTVFDPATAVSDIDASRLLTQATFGPNQASILEVQSLGIENWIEQQFALHGPPHLDYVQLHSNDSNRAPRHEVWWRDVIDGDDQLRQRVAFALSQIFVVSDTGYTLANSQYGITHYYDLLREHAFGNYRELLESITLNPVMGLYLSMLQNAKGDPNASTRADENFAREVLQLFSIGLYQLNLDGTTDGSPSFTQDNIEAFARAFTGWNYADAGQWNRKLFTNADLINPMRPFEAFHDTDAKTLLNSSFYSAEAGGVSPAGQSARADLEFALDNIFNHPNVGPFIAKQLIKRLVTSNPSASYVSAVASVFNDNGTGVRGDLKAVVREILLNDEARTIPAISSYGKLREPVLRLTHLWRAFDVQPGSQSSNRGEYNTLSPQLMDLDSVTGQAVLKSPSVFNFFQPSFSPAGPVADQNLEASEFELFTESNELATTNRLSRQIQQEYANNPSGGLTTSYLNFADELSLANDTTALLDHFDLILLSGNMSDGLRTTLSNHLDALPDTPAGLSQRVRDAVTLIMASPDYLVQM